ncbi:MAG: bifunctional oligoribonuclease/PAP phosphatase NrnA [Acidobacteriota bacterium]
MGEATRDAAVALERLARARRVFITSHSSPDGDAIGSELGMLDLAGQLGIAAMVLNRDPHPANLGFLPGVERVTTGASLPATYASDFDLALIIECPGLDRPGLSGLDQIPLLNIDHHLANEIFGDVNFVDDEAPAVGEMVLAMAEASGAQVTPAMATNLYTALVTDTGDFRYSNATPRAFTAASRLVAAGASPHRIADALWEHVPPRVIRLTAVVLETLELLAGGRLALLRCDRASLERAGAHPEDTENLINLPRSIDGVEVAVLLKAFTKEAVRVSLRSRGAVDVQAVASSFGGGGHRNAAGCTLHSSLEGAREAVLAALLPVLESS